MAVIPEGEEVMAVTWDAATSSTARAHARGPGRTLSLRLAAIALVIVAAELITRANFSALPTSSFPPPSQVARELYNQVQTGFFWQVVAGTFEGWGLAVAAATGLAILVGLLLGTSKWAYRFVRVTIDVLRPLPSLALLPLLILLVPVGLALKVYIVAFAAFWPMLFQALYGVWDVDPVAYDVARSFRLGRLRRFRYIVLPTALPYIGTGLRISSIAAFNVCIATELILGGSGISGIGPGAGIGTALYLAQNANRFTLMWAYVLAAGVFGVLVNIVFGTLERRMLFWHPSQRAEAGA
jgi:ABC-type nitrate/sulfonate/bicarbonate transport system permease component